MILRECNTHGYELIQQLIKFGFDSIHRPRKCLPPIKTVRENMIKMEWNTASSSPAKRVYAITDFRVKYLETWAGVLEQYQKMLGYFIIIYTRFFMSFSVDTNRENKNE